MNNSKKITMIMAVFAVAVMAIAAFVAVMPAENVAADDSPAVYPAILHDNAKVNPIADEDLYTPDTYKITVGDVSEDGCYPLTIAIDGLREHVNGEGKKGYWFGAAFVAPAGADKFQYIWTDAEPNDAEWSEAYDLEKNVYDGKDGVAFYFTPDNNNKFVAIQWVAGDEIVGQEYYEVTYDLPVEMYVGEELIGQFATVKAAYDAITEINEPANDYVIKLLRDCQSPAFGSDGDSERTYTIDLNKFALDITWELVGSTGYASQAIRVLPGQDVTLKSGGITSSDARMMINMYGDLTLSDVLIDGTQLDDASNSKYVLSNNRGTTTITGNTYIIAKEGWYAFDVWGGYGSEDGLTVYFDEEFTGAVVGTYEYTPNKTYDYSLIIDGDGDFTEANIKVNPVAGADNDVFIYSGTFSELYVLDYLAAGADITITGIKGAEYEGTSFTLGVLNEPLMAVDVLIEDSTFSVTGMANGTTSVFCIETGSSITLNNVIMETNGTALYPRGNAASVTVVDSSITAGTYCVGTNASGVENYGVIISLEGSTFISQGYAYDPSTGWDCDDCTVMINVEGTLEINECTITGNRMALLVRAGEATVTDSTINFKNTFVEKKGSDPRDTEAWGSGNEVISKAIVVGNKTANAYLANAVLTIDGETVNNSLEGTYADNLTAYFISDKANDKDTYLITDNFTVGITGSGVYTVDPALKDDDYVGVSGQVSIIADDEEELTIDVLNVADGADVTFDGAIILSAIAFAGDSNFNNEGILTLPEAAYEVDNTLVNSGDVHVAGVNGLMFAAAVTGCVFLDADVAYDGNFVPTAYIYLNGNDLTLNSKATFNGFVVGKEDATASLVLTASDKDIVTIGAGSIKISGTPTGDVTITVVDGIVKINGEDASLAEIDGLTIDASGGNDGKVVLDGELEIAAGKTLTVEEGAVVEIAENGILTNNGTINIEGTVANEGTIENKESTSTIDIAAGAGLNNKGDLNNYANAVITNGGTFSNSGTLINLTDASFTNNAVLVNGNEGTITNDGDLVYAKDSIVEDAGVIGGTVDPDDKGAIKTNGATTATIVENINGGADVVLGTDVTVGADATSIESTVSLYNSKTDAYYTLTVSEGVKLTTTVIGAGDARVTFSNVVAGAGGFTISSGSVVISGTIASGDFIVSGDTTFDGAIITGPVTYTIDTADIKLNIVDLDVVGTGDVTFIFEKAPAEFNINDLTVTSAAKFTIDADVTIGASIKGMDIAGTFELESTAIAPVVLSITKGITVSGTMCINNVTEVVNTIIGYEWITLTGELILDADVTAYGIEKLKGDGYVYVGPAVIQTSGKSSDVTIITSDNVYVCQAAASFDINRIVFAIDGYTITFGASDYATTIIGTTPTLVRAIMISTNGVDAEVPPEVTSTVPNAEGWTINGDDYGFDFDGFEAVSGVYAASVYIPKFTITWYDAEGYVAQLVTDVVKGTDVLPTYTGSKPVKDATAEFTYTFEKWNTKADGSGEDITASTKIVDASITCYPIFTETVNVYTISWIDGDGNVIYTEDLEYGDLPEYDDTTYGEPEKTATEYYTYEWTGAWTPDVDVVIADAAYVATFIGTAKTPVDTIDFTIDVVGDYVVFDATPLAADEYWAWNAGDVKIKLNFSDTEDTGATAIAIVYQVDGVFTIPDLLIPEIEGELYSVDAKAYAKVDGITKYLGTAEWDAEFTVTFAAGEHGTLDGTTVYAGLHYGDDMPVAPTVNPEEGYSFTTWSPALPDFVVGTVTYTAQYEINSYTITLNIDDDEETVVTIEGVEYGADIEDVLADYGFDMDDYTKVGYTPLYTWTPALPATMPDSNVEATANWSHDVYTITFSAGAHGNIDGDPSKVFTPLYYGDDMPEAPEVTADEGYTFAGWDTEPAETVTGNATYTATYTLNTWTLTLNIDDDLESVVSIEGVEYGADIEDVLADYGFDIDDYTKIGYTFAGSWTPALPATMPDADSAYTANWTQNDYTITYAAGEHGNIGGEASVVYAGKHYGDDMPAAPEVTADEGYTFAGWDPVPASKVTATVTYTAQYTANKHDITLNIDDDLESVVSIEGVSFGATIADVLAEYGFDIDDYTKIGYTATGTWTPAMPVTMPDADVVVTAVWSQDEYTVTYDAGEHGSLIGGVTPGLHYGDDTPDAPEVTADVGYTFAGWDPVPAAKVTGTVTYTAQYTVNKHTITLNINDDLETVVSIEDVAYGSIIAEVLADYGFDIDDYTKLGYSFSNWSPAMPLAMPDADRTFDAVWTADEYTVTYAAGEHGTIVGGVTPGLHYGDDTPDAPEVTADVGYTFVGWDPVPAEKVTATVTYTAQYTVNKHTLTLNVNDDLETVVSIEDVEYGSVISEVLEDYGFDIEDYSKIGYTFSNWSPALPVAMPDADRTFDAVWTADVYTVTFNAGEHGNISGEDSKVFTPLYYGDDMPEAPEVTPDEGYSFIGWDTEPAEKVTGNATYTALYEINSWTLTLNINDDDETIISVDDIEYGTSIEAVLDELGFDIDDYTKTGYTAAGTWTPALPEYMPDYNVVVTAVWDPAEYDFEVYFNEKEDPSYTKVVYYDGFVNYQVLLKEGQSITVEYDASVCDIDQDGGKLFVHNITGDVSLRITIVTES